MPFPAGRCVFAAIVALAVALPLAGCAAPSPPSSTGVPTRSPAPTAPAPTAPAPAAPTATAPPAPSSSPAPTAFDRSAHSIDDSTSPWLVVDKLRPLDPLAFVPPDLTVAAVPHLNPPTLRAAAAHAIVTMFAAGKAEGAGEMQLQSAYRSYDLQVKVYAGYVAREGKASADVHSARPGFSEHQTGLAADISTLPLACALAACFGGTRQGSWLAANAYRFGFVLRYPADKQPVTGFSYEPWHFRFVGVELASAMHQEHVTTLEEFFGLPPAPTYGS